MSWSVTLVDKWDWLENVSLWQELPGPIESCAKTGSGGEHSTLWDLLSRLAGYDIYEQLQYSLHIFNMTKNCLDLRTQKPNIFSADSSPQLHVKLRIDIWPFEFTNTYIANMCQYIVFLHIFNQTENRHVSAEGLSRFIIDGSSIGRPVQVHKFYVLDFGTRPNYPN